MKNNNDNNCRSIKMINYKNVNYIYSIGFSSISETK